MGKIVILSIDESEDEVIERIKSVLQHSSVVDIEKVEASNTIQTGGSSNRFCTTYRT